MPQLESNLAWLMARRKIYRGQYSAVIDGGDDLVADEHGTDEVRGVAVLDVDVGVALQTALVLPTGVRKPVFVGVDMLRPPP